MFLQQQSAPTLRRSKKKRSRPLSACCNLELLLTVSVVLSLLLIAAAGLAYEFFSNNVDVSGKDQQRDLVQQKQANNPSLPRHLLPTAPVLPIFASVADEKTKERLLVEKTLDGTDPTVAGVAAILQNFIREFAAANRKFVAEAASSGGRNDDKENENDPTMKIIDAYFDLTARHLGPLEETYRGKPVFPIREDGSIFLSLAAFREHLLADTLAYAFDNAKHPEKLFVGAVVQNCFGKVLDDGVTIDASGLPCKTGAQVIGKNKQGRDMTKVSDAPPDRNGIEEFCTNPEYRKYCDDGQIRVLYIHESESTGPATARYHASKLWGGETYFMQCDSHLMFAKDWDDKYVAELKAARAYPKSILSSYPPGFQDEDSNGGKTGVVVETPGSRLCACLTRVEDPNPIVRLNTGAGYRGGEPRPTQIPFIAAGFFFARAEFLVDVPFDPYMPWLFMGEEIALSMRAWTHGWDIYAPRKNLIAHQYRPGRMGLPKFWGAVNRLYRGYGGAMNNRLQGPVLKRIKHMVGYPDSTLEVIHKEGIDLVLKDIEHYGLGDVRTWKEYMDFANMHVDEQHDAIQCGRNVWCGQGLKD